MSTLGGSWTLGTPINPYQTDESPANICLWVKKILERWRRRLTIGGRPLTINIALHQSLLKIIVPEKPADPVCRSTLMLNVRVDKRKGGVTDGHGTRSRSLRKGLCTA